MKSRELSRRALLKRLALAGLYGASAPLWLRQATASPAAPWTPSILTARQNATVIALCELMIPETETPGAASAQVNRYIDAVLADAEPSVRTRFLDRLDWIDAQRREHEGADLAALLEAAGDDFFREIKTLTIRGYYTSAAAMRAELGE